MPHRTTTTRALTFRNKDFFMSSSDNRRFLGTTSAKANDLLLRRRDKFFGKLRSLAEEILLHLFHQKLLGFRLPGLETVFIQEHLGVLGPHPPRFGAYVFENLLAQRRVKRGLVEPGQLFAQLHAFHHAWHWRSSLLSSSILPNASLAQKLGAVALLFVHTLGLFLEDCELG